MKPLALVANSIVVLLLASMPGVPRAATDPARKCAAAKLKAVAKQTTAAAKCHQTAILKGLAVDAACLEMAESKLAEAIQKADRDGACAGTASALTAAADGCVAAYVAEVQAVTTTTTAAPTTTTSLLAQGCCTFPVAQECRWIAQGACEQAGGIPGGLGDVCDGASGGCLPGGAAMAGNCCTRVNATTGGSICFSGPGITVNECGAGFPQFVGTLSTGVCPPPEANGQSACVP